MILFALLIAAQTGANPTVGDPIAAKPEPEKMICRREVETGSVMAKKVCHTRADWARIAGQNEDRMNRSAGNAQGSGRPPSGS